MQTSNLQDEISSKQASKLVMSKTAIAEDVSVVKMSLRCFERKNHSLFLSGVVKRTHTHFGNSDTHLGNSHSNLGNSHSTLGNSHTHIAVSRATRAQCTIQTLLKRETHITSSDQFYNSNEISHI